MNQSSMQTEPKETKQMEKYEVCYEHAGYQVRLHFSGNKTLMQCMRNLAKRRVEG